MMMTVLRRERERDWRTCRRRLLHPLVYEEGRTDGKVNNILLLLIFVNANLSLSLNGV
jgi:hypothetical protein